MIMRFVRKEGPNPRDHL